MEIGFKKILARILFWIYDFIDTIGAIFKLLTGTEPSDGKRTLLEVFVESAVSIKVLIGLCLVSVVIAGACMAVRIAKNVIKFKSGGEQTSHAVVIKQGFFAILSTVICIFFVFLFISFAAMLLNMVNDVIAPADNMTLSQNLFNLSVEESYVLDEDNIHYEYEDVQDTDPDSEDGLAWEKDSNGNYIYDENNKKIPIYIQQIVDSYYEYKRDENGNLVKETGWCGHSEKCQRNPVNGEFYDTHDARCLSWSMSPNDVFGVHKKDTLGIFEDGDKGYKNNRSPMVRLESFNFFTAYLVAIVILISMFMLSIGLVKRIYDIIVLLLCMPLVCGTIPLDDGARFRAWRATFMSKVLVAFGAVIAINVFYMIGGFIVGSEFGAVLAHLRDEHILNSTAITVFKMILLLGGAMCINGSQTLIARILGTSADESREAMQSLAMITSGVRLGAAGALGAGRMAMGAGRMVFGGTNRYGRQRTGIIPMMFRGGNFVGERVGGQNYINSRGGAFVRTLGRMGRRNGYSLASAGAGAANQNGSASGISQPSMLGGLDSPLTGSLSSRPSAPFTGTGVNKLSAVSQPSSLATGGMSKPQSINNISNSVAPSKNNDSSVKPTTGLRTESGGNKSSAFKDNKRDKR